MLDLSIIFRFSLRTEWTGSSNKHSATERNGFGNSVEEKNVDALSLEN